MERKIKFNLKQKGERGGWGGGVGEEERVIWLEGLLLRMKTIHWGGGERRDYLTNNNNLLICQASFPVSSSVQRNSWYLDVSLTARSWDVSENVSEEVCMSVRECVYVLE